MESFVDRHAYLFNSALCLPVLERVARRGPFAQRSNFRLALDEELAHLTHAQKRAILVDNNRLGFNRRGVGRCSKAEHARAGLDHLSEEEYAKLRNLHEGYESRFGYPFMLALGSLKKGDVFRIFEERLENDPQVELEVAFSNVVRLAHLRYEAQPFPKL